MDVIDTVSCIKAEINNVTTLLRLNTKWSGNQRYLNSIQAKEEESLVNQFRSLNEYLEGLFNISDIDCVRFLTPFKDIIVSEHANGQLTNASLSALCKFVLYGFMEIETINCKEGMGIISICISRCVFEESDWQSDEVILLKLLELSSIIYKTNSASLLTVEASWEIFSTCLSIRNQPKASKILLSEAENCLRHLTLTAFGRTHAALKKYVYKASNRDRIPSSTSSSTSSGSKIDTIGPTVDLVTLENAGKASVGNDDANDPTHSSSSSSLRTDAEVGLDFMNEFANSIQGKSWEDASTSYTIANPVGLTLLLGKVMTTLNSLMDIEQQNSEHIKFALSLINVALEAGGTALGSISPLVDVLRGDVCRHLLRSSQSDDLAVFCVSLRVIFNLFMSIKDHMKIQLEVFLTSVHMRSLATTQTNIQGTNKSNKSQARARARQELALESLLEFCREPALMHDLYTNYDCDVQCTNLFDAIINVLCERSMPTKIYENFLTTFYKSSTDLSRSPSNFLKNVDTFFNDKNYDQNILVSKIRTGTKDIKENDYHILNSLALEGVLAILKSFSTRHAIFDDMDGVSRMKISKTRSSSNSNYSIESLVDQWCSYDSEGNDEFLGTLSETESESELDLNQSFTTEQEVPAILTNHQPTKSDDVKSTDLLRKRKIRKQKLHAIASIFNKAPNNLNWIQAASEMGLLLNIESGSPEDGIIDYTSLHNADAVAKFLRETPGLDKVQVGEFLGKGPAEKYPFQANVLKQYLMTFDFAESPLLDEAMRIFLANFRLPGEAQCIDRIMDAFAGRLFDVIKDNSHSPFKTRDGVFILAFSTIMLNTDLHNPNIAKSKKMKCEDFIRNNRGIDQDSDIPVDYLENLYKRIRNKQIKVIQGINESSQEEDKPYTDTASWNKLLRKSEANQAPAAFTPTIAARRGVAWGGSVFESQARLAQERDMFQVMVEPVLIALITGWERSDSFHTVLKTIRGVVDYASVCIALDMSTIFNILLRILCSRVLNCIKLFASEYETKYDSLRKNDEVLKFLDMDFSNILISLSKSNISDLDELCILRGEMMLKALMYLYRRFAIHVRHSGWKYYFDVLKYARTQQALSAVMMDLDLFYSPNGLKSNMSPYERQFRAYLQQYNHDRRTTGQEGSSMWSFLFGNSNSLPASSQASLQRMNNDEFYLNDTHSHALGGGSDGSYNDQDRASVPKTDGQFFQAFSNSNHFTPLRQCLASCKIDEFLFVHTKELPDDVVHEIAQAAIESTAQKLLELENSIDLDNSINSDNTDSSGEQLESQNRSTRMNLQYMSIAIEGVLVLEWAVKVLKIKIRSILPPDYLISFIMSIFPIAMSLKIPFLMERAIFHLLNYVLVYSPDSKTITNGINLLGSLPDVVYIHLGDRVAVALMRLLTLNSHDNDSERKSQWLSTNWNEVSPILSLCRALNPNTDVLMCDMCQLIVNQNLIQEHSFVPLKDTVISFVKSDSISYGEMDMSHLERSSLSLYLMMKMALTVASSFMEIESVESGRDDEDKLDKKEKSKQQVVFPLPMELSHYSNRIIIKTIEWKDQSTAQSEWLKACEFYTLVMLQECPISDVAATCLKALLNGTATILTFPIEIWCNAFSVMVAHVDKLIEMNQTHIYHQVKNISILSNALIGHFELLCDQPLFCEAWKVYVGSLVMMITNGQLPDAAINQQILDMSLSSLRIAKFSTKNTMIMNETWSVLRQIENQLVSNNPNSKFLQDVIMSYQEPTAINTNDLISSYDIRREVYSYDGNRKVEDQKGVEEVETETEQVHVGTSSIIDVPPPSILPISTVADTITFTSTTTPDASSLFMCTNTTPNYSATSDASSLFASIGSTNPEANDESSLFSPLPTSASETAPTEIPPFMSSPLPSEPIVGEPTHEDTSSALSPSLSLIPNKHITADGEVGETETKDNTATNTGRSTGTTTVSFWGNLFGYSDQPTNEVIHV